VVILLDSITRLGRAYNLAAPSGGRTLTGGIDSGALHAPKRLLGAARNIEGGGSLTIIATALVDTGSAGDGLIFEEFKSTGNAELRLKRAVADRRIFPAVDVEATGTRHDELLLAPDELVLVRALRRALQPQQGTEALLERLRRTGSNAEFLRGLR
jgi:transcription termination factor Rho